NATINANRVIFYLKRMPLVGKRIPDRLYSDSELKMIATVVVTILNVMRKLIGKALYVGLMMVLPLMLLFKEIQPGDYPAAFLHLFFFLSMIAGTVQISALLESNRNKYICIRLMRFNARDFVVPTLFARHTANFIYFLPSIMIAYALLGGEVLHGLLLLLLMTAFRLSFEAVQLLVYDKTKILINKRYLIQWIVIIPSLTAAYLPLFFRSVWPVGKVLFSLPVALLFAAAAAAAIGYILKYPEYKRVTEATLKLDDIMVDFSKMKGEATFSSVKMKEKDFSEETLQSGKYEKKQGYEYLNAIFFERHRKLLEKPIRIRLVVIGTILAAGIVISLLFPQAAELLDENILSILPSFVFVMYFISLGDRVCKAMFYNCDISLLRYSFYREKDVILRNFMVRLRKVTELNLTIGIAICAALYGFVAATGISFQWMDLILFTISILCLSVFFSVHHLFLYYVFQPYTTELGVKNPFFKIINTVVYLACFACMQLRNVPGYFTLIVIGATVTYIITGLTLVYRLAPSNFRVK
ncbi:MAG: hypothetical protein PHC91_11470, partial [Eubacteriales bacterium]|nr:hypothetical protein [Eubacteriales bacterium]